MQRAFDKFIPIPDNTGTIMVIEKEFGPDAARDWAKLACTVVEIVKCTFGTAALYDEKLITQKIEIYRNAGLSPMIGGTLTEVAILSAGGYSEEHLNDYLEYAGSLGFTHLEFSDGTIHVPDNDRDKIIKMIKRAGFSVIAEVGKKDPQKDVLISTDKRIELMKQDLESGAEMVIIEAREGGKGIGVMDKDGKVDLSELDIIIQAVGLENTMIEAPEKGQQQTIFKHYGPCANIGNVQPRDVLSAGALRTGLRGDTISILRKEAWTKYHQAISAPENY